MPFGLIRLIITQKVLKTHSNKSAKQHYLGSNQQRRQKKTCLDLMLIECVCDNENILLV